MTCSHRYTNTYGDSPRRICGWAGQWQDCVFDDGYLDECPLAESADKASELVRDAKGERDYDSDE